METKLSSNNITGNTINNVNTGDNINNVNTGIITDLRRFEAEDDLSQLIDNDEDDYSGHSGHGNSARVVNYLTNMETQSSFLRRQRLTTASTLDLPVREKKDFTTTEIIL